MALVANPRGEVFSLPDEQLSDALDQGYMPATPEQRAAVEEKRAFTEGPVNQIKAFGEGAGSAASFGLTDVAERVAGVDPRGMELRSHTLAHGVGTGAGLILPALLGDEAGPAALLAKGAKGVGEAVGEGALGAVARGATEGAGFGAGAAISGAARGEPTDAQSVAEKVGLGALTGGALSGAGSAIASGAQSLAPVIGPKLADWLDGFEATRNIKAAGGIQQDIRNAEQKIGKEGLRKLSLEAPDVGLFGHGLIDQLTTDPAAVYDRSRDLMKSAGTEMGAILDHADATAKTAPGIGEYVRRAKEDVIGPLLENSRETATGNRVAREVAQDAATFEDAGFKDLHDLRRQISDKLYGLRGTQDPEGTAYKSALHDLRTIVSDEIDRGLKANGLDSAAWQAANRKYQIGATFNRFADRGVQRMQGNNLVPLTTILGGIAGVGHGAFGGLGGALLAYGAKRYGSAVLGTGARALRTVADALIERAGAAAPSAEAALGDAEEMAAHVAPLGVRAILNGEEGPGVLHEAARQSAPKIVDALDSLNAERYGPEDSKLARAMGGSAFTTPERLVEHAQEAAARAESDLTAAVDRFPPRAVTSLRDMLAAIQTSAGSDAEPELRRALLDFAQDRARRADVSEDVRAPWSAATRLLKLGKDASVPLTFADALALSKRLASVRGSEPARDAIEKILSENLSGEQMKAWSTYVAARDEAERVGELARKASAARAPRVRNPLTPEEALAEARGGPLAAAAHSALGDMANVEGVAGQRIGAPNALAEAFGKHIPGFAPEQAPGEWAGEQAAATQDARDMAAPPGTPPSVGPEQPPTHETAAALVALKAFQEDAQKRIESAAEAVVSGKVPPEIKAGPIPKTDDVVKSMERVRVLAGDPQKLADAMGQHTSGLAEHAPNIAQATSNAMARAIMYLAAHLPAVRQPSIVDPEPGKPSRAAAVDYWQIQEALADPTKTLANNPTDAQVQAIDAVHPAQKATRSLALVKALGPSPKFQSVVRVQRITGLPLTGPRLPPIPLKPPIAPAKEQASSRKSPAQAAKFAQSYRPATDTTFAKESR